MQRRILIRDLNGRPVDEPIFSSMIPSAAPTGRHVPNFIPELYHFGFVFRIDGFRQDRFDDDSCLEPFMAKYDTPADQRTLVDEILCRTEQATDRAGISMNFVGRSRLTHP